MARKKDLKSKVEEQLTAMLESKDEPSEGRMKLLQLGIKMCALNAKLEENDYGDFFRDDEPGSAPGHEAGAKPASRKRTNGAAAPDAE